mmetsp:Transcript_50041/g.89810  ORF Transcript_50041/g.89810 Transcript_50041/m.89810 type:complete len:267 (-) Transcript_50041:1504-2304(-)
MQGRRAIFQLPLHFIPFFFRLTCIFWLQLIEDLAKPGPQLCQEPVLGEHLPEDASAASKPDLKRFLKMLEASQLSLTRVSFSGHRRLISRRIQAPSHSCDSTLHGITLLNDTLCCICCERQDTALLCSASSVVLLRSSFRIELIHDHLLSAKFFLLFSLLDTPRLEPVLGIEEEVLVEFLLRGLSCFLRQTLSEPVRLFLAVVAIVIRIFVLPAKLFVHVLNLKSKVSDASAHLDDDLLGLFRILFELLIVIREFLQEKNSRIRRR